MPPRPRSRPQPAPAPSPAIADQLDRIVPMFDALIRDARLGHPISPRVYHDLETRAQDLASAIVAAFRGNAPSGASKASAAPLWRDGGKAWW